MLDCLKFKEVVEISRDTLEDLFKTNLSGDFFELYVNEDEFEVKVKYKNNKDFQNDVLDILNSQLLESELDTYKESVLDYNLNNNNNSNFFVTYTIEDLKKFLSRNIGKNIISKFYSDDSTEHFIFIIDNNK